MLFQYHQHIFTAQHGLL